MKPGARVEVLLDWAYNTDPSWIGGRTYVRTEADGNVICLIQEGVCAGCEVRYRKEQVRELSSQGSEKATDQ